jgi:hypothetical protein
LSKIQKCLVRISFLLSSNSFSLLEEQGDDSDGQITWDNPEQLTRYISTLCAAAEKVKTENLK